MIAPKCLAEIANAIGRELKPSEVTGIEERLQRHLNMLAKRDRSAFHAMSLHERLTEAAKSAAAEVLGDAERRAKNVSRQILANARNLEQMKTLAKGGPMREGLAKVLDQADSYVKGTQRDNFTRILDTIQAAEPRFFELVENKEALRDFVREVFGENTGNDVAAKGAKAWLEGAEAMRQRFNRAGGDTGKLSYGYIPQPHDQARIIKAGPDRWIEDTLPKLDRSRYTDAIGGQMSEGELRQSLRGIWDTLSSGGLNRLEPGKLVGESALANTRAEHRFIHFRDADSYIAYMQDYGRGSVFEAMQHYVQGVSRDTGLIELFGPNPEATFTSLNTAAQIVDGGKPTLGVLRHWTTNDNLWKALTGYYGRTVDPTWANIHIGIRNVMSAGKLQSTLLSSINDLPSVVMAAYYNNVPILQTLWTGLKEIAPNGGERAEYANRVGLMADSIISDMNRWAGDNLAQGWTGRIANVTQKVSLLNRWTDGNRRAFALGYMGALGKMTRGEWAALDATDRSRLEARGVDQSMFDTWRAATPEDWQGSKMLTPESIRAIPDIDPAKADAAVSRLLGLIVDESEFAVQNPDLTTRARVQSVGQRGTFNGELGRHFMLFKSFTMTMVSRQVRRIAQMDDGMAKLGYSVSLMSGMMAFGALSMQAKDIVAGKDPKDMTGDSGRDLTRLAKFWGSAFAQGGGAGIYGDILYTGMGGNAQGGQPNWASLGGPVFGTAMDLANVTVGNAAQAMRHEKTNLAGELGRIVRGNSPFLNLWYAKAAIDHALLHELQDTLAPGYLSRMRSQAAKDYGQSFWWEPAHASVVSGNMTLPQRGPDLTAALGSR